MKLPIYETSDTKLNIMLETILSQRRMPWFYEHFVNVELVGEYDMVFYFTDLETNKQLRPFWSTFGVLYYDEIHDETEALKVIDFALNKGAYCNIWVDKEFISGTDEYNVYKFFHPLLIFGKDEERNEYCAVNFTDLSRLIC